MEFASFITEVKISVVSHWSHKSFYVKNFTTFVFVDGMTPALHKDNSNRARICFGKREFREKNLNKKYARILITLHVLSAILFKILY